MKQYFICITFMNIKARKEIFLGPKLSKKSVSWSVFMLIFNFVLINIIEEEEKHVLSATNPPTKIIKVYVMFITLKTHQY